MKEGTFLYKSTGSFLNIFDYRIDAVLILEEYQLRLE